VSSSCHLSRLCLRFPVSAIAACRCHCVIMPGRCDGISSLSLYFGVIVFRYCHLFLSFSLHIIVVSSRSVAPLLVIVSGGFIRFKIGICLRKVYNYRRFAFDCMSVKQAISLQLRSFLVSYARRAFYSSASNTCRFQVGREVPSYRSLARIPTLEITRWGEVKPLKQDCGSRDLIEQTSFKLCKSIRIFNEHFADLKSTPCIAKHHLSLNKSTTILKSPPTTIRLGPPMENL
jgi:hypothetical protein